MTSDILKYFRPDRTPRAIQSQVLLALEKLWDTADVFVISLPVGAGKSGVAHTLGKWLNNSKKSGAHVVTPTNQLVDQYLHDFPEMTVLRSKSSRRCNTWGKPLSALTRGLCSPLLKCGGCTQYKHDQVAARTSQLLVNNYHTYLFNQLYRPTLIVDEAHLLLPVLREFSVINIWEKNKVPFPNPSNLQEFIQWADSHPVYGQNWAKLKKELRNQEAGKPQYFLELGHSYYRGQMKKCLKMIPISLDYCPPRMWPAGVNKIILLSATIGKKDVQALGLGKKRVIFMDGESPILAAQRPTIYAESLAVNMGASHVSNSTSKNLVRFGEILSQISRANEGSKGVVHLTYSLAQKVREMDTLPGDLRTRLLFHTKDTKDKVYQEFRNSSEPKILVASGMYEGIDLPYDLARWQVIGKIPWGNLGDSITKYLSESDPEAYVWEAMKKLIQATGRTTRAEDDFSRVWIVDSTFRQLWDQYRLLFPRWFRDGMQIIEVEKREKVE